MDQRPHMMNRRQQIVNGLKDKGYRDAFVRQQATTDIPFQIRGMRAQRGWTQAELAQKLGKQQSVVSRLENPKYGKFTLKTLHELAAEFDVGLLVTFVSFSALANRAASYGIADVEIPAFDEDPGIEPQDDREEALESNMRPL